jgi:hypothetical protein
MPLLDDVRSVAGMDLDRVMESAKTALHNRIMDASKLGETSVEINSLLSNDEAWNRVLFDAWRNLPKGFTITATYIGKSGYMNCGRYYKYFVYWR